jgi:WD40 repeat protein
LQHDGVEVTAAVFQPDGSLLATARVDGTITVWETETGERPWQHRAHQARPTQVRFSPSGARLLTTDADGTVVIHDVATGKLTASRAAHEAAIVSARFSPDGLLIATAAADRSCRLWEAATMDLLATLDDWAPGTAARQKHVFDVVFADGAKRLLTSSEDSHLRVYDLSSMPPILTRATPTSAVGWLSRRPDGGFVEAFKWVGTVAVRAGLHSDRLTVRPIHGARLTDVDLSPDGRTLLTTSLDGTAILSRVPSLEPVAHLLGHTDFVTVGRFGPNGSRVITGSKDGTARIWPVDPAAAARNRLPIDLTSPD